MQPDDLDAIADVVASAIKAATAPLIERLAVLESRPVIHGKDGRDGVDGAAGKDGRDGIDGKDGDPGLNGKDGANGIDGKNGADGQPGRDGRDGQPGTQGIQGEKGGDGLNGKDGADGRNGIDGKDGTNGRDGTLENLKAIFDGERTVTLCFKDGTPIEGGVIRLPVPVFKGMFVDGTAYAANDMVQWDGSGWIALKDNPPLKPGAGSPEATGWKLWIKKGAEGKQGKPGIQGEQGPKGKDGAPGRDYR